MSDTNDGRDKLGESLGVYAVIFRLIGVVAALGLVFLGFSRGNEGNTAGAVTFWVGAVVVLLQTMWVAAVSDAIARLLFATREK